MALQNKGREYGQVVVRSPEDVGVGRSAGLIPQANFNEAMEVPNFAPMPVQPVATFAVMPGGGKKFNYSDINVLNGQADGRLLRWNPPGGYVGVVNGFRVEYVAGGSGVIGDFDLNIQLRKDSSVDPGNRSVWIDAFDDSWHDCHVVLGQGSEFSIWGWWSGSQVLSQEVRVLIRGSLLLPNQLAPEFTELVAGEVVSR